MSLTQVTDKIVVWVDKDLKMTEYKRCYEDYTPKGKLKIFKTIWFLLIDRGFRWQFEETLKYTLRHASCYRGTGASDVLMFQVHKKADKIWK